MAQKHILSSVDEVSTFSAKFVVDTAVEAINERGIFTLGVSGGSIINILASNLAENPNVNWSKWKVFFCDERLSSFSSEDSTYGQFKSKLIDKVGCHDSWVAINPELPVVECAKDYEEKLKKTFTGSWPEFDLLLLGMGPDGHTCSLFPGHQLLQEKEKWIAPISDSPKPPPCRVTMTYPVINNARKVAFISAGSGKADTIKAIFTPVDDESKLLPAARVKPTSGSLHWIMDTGAASKL
uniref:6-phosphogluconolactonase n=1 Tax=Phallusia mammillata TaxID=59560 RepID=A0A6F9DN10_9ASCI|nr:6-phosphogluconolactonase-like [Phallusia mammillata]